MEADIQLLVLSEGKSNILPADMVLPFQPSSVDSFEAPAEALEAWRWYLATIRSLPHSIGQEIQTVGTFMSYEILNSSCFTLLFLTPWVLSSSFNTLQVIEDDLVEAKQVDRSMGTQDFSRLETRNLSNCSSIFKNKQASLII